MDTPDGPPVLRIGELSRRLGVSRSGLSPARCDVAADAAVATEPASRPAIAVAAARYLRGLV